MVNNKVTSVIGASIADRTTNNRTRAALGTDADDMEAAVDVSKTVTNSPKPNVIPLIWAMNMEATDMKSAVPSMLMLQPIGRTNRVIRGSMRSLSFMERNVIGSAAALLNLFVCFFFGWLKKCFANNLGYMKLTLMLLQMRLTLDELSRNKIWMDSFSEKQNK